jgi:Glycoside hydrolase family 44
MHNPYVRIAVSFGLLTSCCAFISAQTPQVSGSVRPAKPNKATLSASSSVAASAGSAHQPKAAAQGPDLNIDVAAGLHAISPLIYGIDYDQNQIPNINPSIIRWGGDATSQYNWQTGNTNAGSDYYFINSNQNSGSTPPDFNTFFSTNKAAGVQTIGTIPINGWVAKDSTSCAFSVKKYGAQQMAEPGNADCGNGILPDGKTPITQVSIGSCSTPPCTDPTDADVTVTTSTMQEWVSSVVSNFGSTANGGVAIWELDNEPVWWESVHQNIHPAYTDYDEVWQKGLAYAQAVKAADPTAKVSGPITSGWSDLFFSRVDLQSGWSTGPNFVYWGNPTDRLAHGNLDFVAWYLQQFASYDQQHSQRLLDYFDIHGYMPGTGGDATDPASDAARLESTRVFWDPAFTPPNTNEYILNTPENPANNPSAPCVCLIPRMKNWVAANYPGTKLAITEYNLGAQGDVNGALAQADLLGIFGREGVDVAVMWPFLGYPNDPLSAPVTFAFAMYRDYDGAKSTFGDMGVSAVSADQSQLSVYAARRSSDSSLTVMVINKTGNDLTSNFNIANFTPNVPNAAGFIYSGAYPNFIVPLAPSPANLTSRTFPANSVTLLVFANNISISATPNPIPVAPGATTGQTTINWNYPPSNALEVHIGSPTGTLFVQGGSSGSQQTGNWVTNGMQFFLVDSASKALIDSTTVTLSSNQPATISASPNPISVAPGVTLGQTAISWNAPNSTSVGVHIGSATGTLFAGGGPTGSAPTGDWVSNGMQFVLVDATTQATLATTTVNLTTGGSATITANPNPIQVASGVTLGQTTISWNAPGSTTVEVHIGSATGALFSSGGSSGAAQTGDWVSNGMVFVLVDGVSHAQLASTTVSLTTPEVAPTISAGPNPISVETGVGVGQTTIYWNAPGSNSVEVHVGSASGNLFASGGSSGSSLTGDWVSNGMVFFLVDSSTHSVLATTTVSLTGT